MNVLSLDTGVTESRNRRIDFLRGCAMILVLLHHSGNPHGRYILAFHMPLFFLISGYTGFISKGYEKKFKDFVINKCNRLLIPYFLFEVVNLIIWCGKCWIEKNSMPGVESIISIILCDNNYFSGLYGRLWFLPCMFVANIYAWFVINKYRGGMESVIIMLMLSFISTNVIKIRLPFTVDTAFFASAFILIGYYCFGFIEKLIRNKKDVYDNVLMFICAIYLVYAVKFTDVKMLMYINKYGEYTVSICAAVSGCIAFLIAGSWAYKMSEKSILKKIIIWYGNNSLVTFPVHLFIKMMIIMYIPVLSLWYILFFIMLMLNILVVNIITFYFPFMLGNNKKVLKE